MEFDSPSFPAGSGLNAAVAIRIRPGFGGKSAELHDGSQRDTAKSKGAHVLCASPGSTSQPREL
jgi:hypothetical protein